MRAKRPTLKAELDKHFRILEDMLTEHRFLLSEDPSLADFAVFGAITPLSYSGNTIPLEFKALGSWSRSIEQI